MEEDRSHEHHWKSIHESIETTTHLQCHTPLASHRSRPASPFAAHAVQVEILALDDGLFRLGHHHLGCSGIRARENGQLGPRHAIRGTVLWIREARIAGIQAFRGALGAGAYCVNREA